MRVPVAILTRLLTRKDVEVALHTLVSWNMYLIRSRHLPSIYDAGVRYKREPKDKDGIRRMERWEAIDVLIDRGYGDCEDLAAALCAQRRLEGKRAYCELVRETENLVHVVVRIKEDHRSYIEDPSLLLGM